MNDEVEQKQEPIDTHDVDVDRDCPRPSELEYGFESISQFLL